MAYGYILFLFEQGRVSKPLFLVFSIFDFLHYGQNVLMNLYSVGRYVQNAFSNSSVREMCAEYIL